MKDFDAAIDGLGKIESLPPVFGYLSTGCTILDLALANQLPGGFPTGRVSHVYGAESTAKTIIACEPLGSAQRQKGKAYFVDAEMTLDIDRACKLHGISTDPEKWYYDNSPETIEDLFDDTIESIIKTRDTDSLPGAVAIDSLSALSSKEEIITDLAKSGFHVSRARQMSQAFRKYRAKVAACNLALIFVDQSRDNVGIMWGDKETTSGGRALKFYSSCRVKLSHQGKIKNKYDKVVGVKLGFLIVKNKIAPPFRNGSFYVLFDYGIDDIRTSLEWLKENSIIKQVVDDIDEEDDEPRAKRTSRSLDIFDRSFISTNSAIEHVEKNGLEKQLIELVKARWNELYAKVERKEKVRTD